MQRDRPQTEQRLIDAVGQIITETGFDQLGINRIARLSGVNKILIYRYFGGLDGLLEAYYERRSPIIAVRPLDLEQLRNASLDEFFDTCYNHLINEFRLLRQNTEAKEFLKASLMGNSGRHAPLAVKTEEQLRQMADDLASILKIEDGRSFSAIILSTMTLLTFMSHEKRTFLGIDLGTDAGWAQVEGALRNIYRGAYLVTKERLSTDKETA